MDGNDLERKPWYKRFWGIALIALGGLMGLFVLLVVVAGVVYAVNGGTAPESTGTTVDVESTTTPVPETSTTMATTTTTMAPTTTTMAPTTTTVPEPTTTQASTTTSSVVAKDSQETESLDHNLTGPWTMPDLVGENLQDAQDIIQSITYGGIVVTYSHDATEEERSQVLDAGWVVCDQSIAPGVSITRESLIDFGVVRVFETCP